MLEHSTPKKGFTLAEVLVTLGIIGVVSAMTIPSLTQNWQKQAYVAQLKKVYSEISQAVSAAIQDEMAINMGETSYNYNARNVNGFLHKYFKVVQDCGRNKQPCFASNYKNIDGSSYRRGFDCTASVSIASGAAICIDGDGWWPDDEDWHYSVYAYVDVNGKKGPNIFGRDMFFMEIYGDGTIGDSYQAKNWWGHGYGCVPSPGIYGNGCITSILVDGWSMDY